MIFNLQTTLIAAGAAAVVGAASGAYATRAYYAPRLQVEQLKVAGLAKDVSDQNDALDDLRDEGERRKKAAAEAMEKAKGVASDHEKRAQEILRRPTPAGMDECTEVETMFREVLGK